MARKLITTVEIHIRCEEVVTDLGAGAAPARLVHSFDYSKQFASGTTNGTQLDRAWSGKPTYTTTPSDVDLKGTANLPSVLDGSLNCNFDDLCIVALQHRGASTDGDIEIGGDGSAPVVGMLKAGNDIAVVKPEGVLVWVAPYGIAPVAGTGDVLQVAASSGTVAASALIAGRSA